MNKIFKYFAIASALLLSNVVSAQILITRDLMGKTSYSVAAEVVDSLTNEPISFASVYLKHPKDTLITNFSLTDTLGKVKLTEVTQGEYDFFVEYMGYKPYRRGVYIRGDKEMPVIKLQLDREALKAARVSAVGNAIEFKQDTVIYNASSFRSLAGDNLSDLLKKMPGVEVSSSGEVKVNGKAVSKITVNGKTFFMGDNKAALDNLPAQFVDKVKVVDKETDEAEFTGIKAGEKEKVMDVELKEEYKKGFFGNLKLAGGSSIKDRNASEFVANKDFIYDASAMASAYGEKNQLTLISNARNVVAEEQYGYFSISNGLDDLSLGTDGLHSNWSAGANLNTDAVKGLAVNVSTLYNSEAADKHSRSDRTTFLNGGKDMFETSETVGSGTLETANLKFQLEKKDTKKYFFTFTPAFRYKNYNEASTTMSSSSVEDVEMNGTEAFTSTSAKLYSTDGYINLGVREFGKPRRSLSMYANYALQAQDGFKDDISSTWFHDDNPLDRNLHYADDMNSSLVYTTIQYVEPFGDKWALRTSLSGDFTFRSSTSVAHNADGTKNDYFSSVTDNRYTSYSGDILGQYMKGRTSLQFGGTLRAVNNENYARSYGLDTRTGVGEWQKSISPYLRYMTSIKGMRWQTYIMSSTSSPSGSSIVPTFNIVNPTRLTVGNIYLRPSSQSTLYTNLFGRVKDVTVNMYLQYMHTENGSISAVWFDENNIRYSMPVNSAKPSGRFMANAHFTIPLNKEKTVSVEYSPTFNSTRAVGYQAKGMLAGFNPDTFDYSAFMKDFWGNASGDRFYSGQSGFRESLTNQYSIGNMLRLALNFDRFRMYARAQFTNNRSTYSLDPRANTNTWNNRFSIAPEYSAPHDWEFSAAGAYIMRTGYGEGYDDNYFDFGLRVTKNFKAFSIGLIGSNLLNNERSLRRVISDDFVQDSYSVIVGRKLLLNITYNFGKMNAAKSQSARNASINMMY